MFMLLVFFLPKRETPESKDELNVWLIELIVAV